MALFGSDSLSVRVSANTRDFTRGINSAQENLQDLRNSSLSSTGALQVLQASADEAGDEISSMGRDASQSAAQMGALGGTAAGTTGTFTALTASTEGLSLSFGSLTTGMTGTAILLGGIAAAATGLLSTLVPLTAVLGTLTGGFGALASAFGLVIGSGILAFGEKLGRQEKQRLERITQEIELLEEAKEGRGELTEAAQERLQTLKEEQDELEDQAGIMGGLKEAMAGLREEIQPLIVDFGQTFIPLIESAVDALPALVRNTLNMIGPLTSFKNVLRDLGREAFRTIPVMARDFIDFARVALPAFMDFVSFIGSVADDVITGMIQTTRGLSDELLAFVDTVIGALPEINTLGTFILNTLIPAMEGFFSVLEDVVNIGIESDGLVGFLGSLIQNAADWLNGEGEAQLQNLMTGLFGSLADILTNNRETLRQELFMPIQSILASLFDSLTIALASDEASRLGKAIGRTSVMIMSILGDAAITYARSDAFAKDIGQLGNATINAIASVIAGAAASNIQTGGLTGSLALGAAREIQSGFPESTLFRNRERGNTTQTTNPNVNVTIEGELPEDSIRNVSVDVWDDRERASNRQTGRNPNPRT